MYAIGALVIAPTRYLQFCCTAICYILICRELATQIYRVFSQISQNYVDMNCLLYIGGTDIEDTSSNFEKHGGQVAVFKNSLICIANNVRNDDRL